MHLVVVAIDSSITIKNRLVITIILDLIIIKGRYFNRIKDQKEPNNKINRIKLNTNSKI